MEREDVTVKSIRDDVCSKGTLAIVNKKAYTPCPFCFKDQLYNCEDVIKAHYSINVLVKISRKSNILK